MSVLQIVMLLKILNISRPCGRRLLKNGPYSRNATHMKDSRSENTGTYYIHYPFVIFVS